MAVRIAVHGHFYQPPREDPWTGEIEPQPDAAPARDWNERVHDECYRPNTEAAIPTTDGETWIANNFEKLSFNVGPTLMAWMEKAHPDTHARIIEADRASLERTGHGNAIAQAFHHTILPLSTTRDIRTQVRWGLFDFRHRFGRQAEGMWLPETAANDAVLGVLIEEGVGFTILAPHQAELWRAQDGEWRRASDDPIDTRVPYRYEHVDGSGRSLIIFFYDGPLAQEIAFGNLGSSAEKYLGAFYARAGDGLVHAATDGETYGHHHKFSDLGLAFALFVEAERHGIEIMNYATFLDQTEVTHEVRIHRGEGTSWSCHHGVQRWMSDCGCSTYGPPGWHQQWRAPLRAGLEVIRWAADETYDLLAKPIFVDPWGARDRYVAVVVGAERLDDFLEGETAGMADAGALDRAARLLEMQRNAMSMFTSCGWFFYDVSRIESVQILRYAARTLELLASLDLPLPEDAYMPLLAEARSNDPSLGSAATILQTIKEAKRI